MSIWSRLPEDYRNAVHVEEEELELLAADMGIARYRDERYSNPKSRGVPERKLIVHCLDRMTTAVEDLQLHVAAGKPAKGVSHWGYPMLALPADKLAFLTLAEILNHADEADSTTMRIASAIGSRLNIEREFLLIRKIAPDVYEKVKKHNKNWTRRAHRTAKTKAGGVDTGWDARSKAWLGMILLELVLKNTDLISLKRYSFQGKTQVLVILQPHLKEVIESAHSECELLRPFHMPMVVPPLDWTNQNNGGYKFHRVPLIKTQSAGQFDEERACHEMPKVLEAVNAVQQTEWRINRAVYEVLSQVWNAGGGWAGLPLANLVEPAPPDFDWDKATDKMKTTWKLHATRIHDENARLKSCRKSILHKLAIAKRVKDRAVIYFPHQLDWRGRLYPLPSHLHPQGDDAARGLLHFAKAKRLGERGMYWLKVHLANCYGVDKVSLDERVRWCDRVLPYVRQSAENPIDNRWWSAGDKPWQTLAACFELAKATPDSFSTLPIQVDGSCNGLQHFSAMGRDEVGGRAVNLVPQETPQDIYGEIAKSVSTLIEEDICSDQSETTIPVVMKTNTITSKTLKDIAIGWKGKVDRSLVKRPTMTIVYGLTKQGMQTQYIEDGHCDDFDGPLHVYAGYLRDKTWDALSGVLTGASAIMDWLRAVAKDASKEGLPVRWTTPIGFLVIQEYVEQKVTHLYTALQKLSIRQPREDGKISTARQIRGLPPNFVHSFDASHMMATVLACSEAGLRSYSMIHDSYGTHAADMDTMNRCLREEFVKMYEGFSLARLHRGWQLELGIELPEPPTPGSLDLTQVIQSPYFFA